MRTLGEAIRRLRKAKSLSQDELGAAAGINGQTVSNIEKGHVRAAYDTYRRLATALGLTVEGLDAEWDAPEAQYVSVRLRKEVADGLTARAVREMGDGATLVAWMEQQAELVTTQIVDRDAGRAKPKGRPPPRGRNPKARPK